MVLGLFLLSAVAVAGGAVPAGMGERATPGGTVSLIASPSAGTAPLLVSFAANVSGSSGTVIANWSFGDGATLSGSGVAALEPAHLYDTPGNYSAQVSITDAQGTSRASTLIRVGSAPLIASISADPRSGATPLTVTFHAVVQGGSGTYERLLWQFGDGGLGEGAMVRYTYSRAGHFLVNLTATDTQNRSGHGSVEVAVTDGSVTPADGPAPPSTTSTWVLWASVVAGGTAAVGLLSYLILARRDRWDLPAGSDPGPSSESPVERPIPDVHVPYSAALDAEAGVPGVGASDGPDPADPGVERAPDSRGPPVFARRLADRLLDHLLGLGPLVPTEAPGPERTQPGIAAALGTQQNVVSKVLLRLTAAGLVTAESGPVLGQARRMKVYRLTTAGEKLARARSAGAWPDEAPHAPEPPTSSPARAPSSPP